MLLSFQGLSRCLTFPTFPLSEHPSFASNDNEIFPPSPRHRQVLRDASRSFNQSGIRLESNPNIRSAHQTTPPQETFQSLILIYVHAAGSPGRLATTAHKLLFVSVAPNSNKERATSASTHKNTKSTCKVRTCRAWYHQISRSNSRYVNIARSKSPKVPRFTHPKAAVLNMKFPACIFDMMTTFYRSRDL